MKRVMQLVLAVIFALEVSAKRGGGGRRRRLQHGFDQRDFDTEIHQHGRRQSTSKNARFYCDSTAEQQQYCMDKTPCSPEFLDCTTKGLKRCICGSEPMAHSAPALKEAEVNPAVPGPSTLAQIKASRMNYCDSTTNQRCKDGTPCTAELLDCETKGPKRCLCPALASSSRPGDLPGQHGGGPVIDASATEGFEVEKEAEGVSWDFFAGDDAVRDGGEDGGEDGGARDTDSKSRSKFDPMAGGRRSGGPQLHLALGIRYCDSTKHQKCKDGTPCTAELLDCTTKGPKRCICPAFDPTKLSAEPAQDLPDLPIATDLDVPSMVDPVLDFDADAEPQPIDAVSAVAPAFTNLNLRYCDSTKEHQKCKDGTRCTAELLDCTTKGPKRCICPAFDPTKLSAEPAQDLPVPSMLSTPMQDLPSMNAPMPEHSSSSSTPTLLEQFQMIDVDDDDEDDDEFTKDLGSRRQAPAVQPGATQWQGDGSVQQQSEFVPLEVEDVVELGILPGLQLGTLPTPPQLGLPDLVIP